MVNPKESYFDLIAEEQSEILNSAERQFQVD